MAAAAPLASLRSLLRRGTPSAPARAALAAAACALALLAFAPPAALGSTRDVIRDCARDGTVDRNRSNKDLRRALKELPSDLDEYTDCRDALEAALHRRTGGSGKGGSGGSAGVGGGAGAGAATPADEVAFEALKQAVTAGEDAPEVKIDGGVVSPDDGPLATARAANGLPLAILLSILALAALGAGAGALALRGRLRPLLDRLGGAPGEASGAADGGRLSGMRRALLRLLRR